VHGRMLRWLSGLVSDHAAGDGGFQFSDWRNGHCVQRLRLEVWSSDAGQLHPDLHSADSCGLGVESGRGAHRWGRECFPSHARGGSAVGLGGAEMSYRSTVNAPYLGAIDPNCAAGMPFDVNGSPCIDECAAGMPYDSNGTPCPAPSGTVYTAFGTEEYGAAASSGAPPSTKPAVTTFPSTVALPPGPSPRVAVPVSTAIPGSFGLWFTNSSLIAGIPNWEVLGGALAIVSLISGVLGGKRRRR